MAFQMEKIGFGATFAMWESLWADQHRESERLIYPNGTDETDPAVRGQRKTIPKIGEIVNQHPPIKRSTARTMRTVVEVMMVRLSI